MQEVSEAQMRGNWLLRAGSLTGKACERTLQSPKGSLAMLAGLLGLSFVARAVSAGAKPFWFDELFTVLMAGLPSMAKVREVLAAGADAMPLFYYWLEKQAGRLPLDPHIAFRLPSIAGYVLATVGVYFFARRWLSPAAGLISALVLALSPFRDYAIEARPYALMVGFVAVGATLWQRIDDGWPYALLLGASLGLGVASHHYTVVALVCFGLAELTVLGLRRRWRWRAWIPLAVATGPFWLGLPLLLRFRQVVGPHYWAKPDWTGVTSTILLSGLSLGYFVPFVLASVLGLAHLLRRRRQNTGEVLREAGASVPDLLLAGMLLGFPVLLLGITLATGGGYVPCYNWPFIIGFAALCGWAAESFLNRTVVLWFCAALACSLCLREGFELVTNWNHDPRSRYTQALRNLAEVEPLLEPKLPIARAEISESLALFYYAGREAPARLTAPADAEAQRRYTGRGTVPLVMLALSRAIPLNVQRTGEFLASHPRFYVWLSPQQPLWLLHDLKRRGVQLRLAAVGRGQDFFFLAEAQQP